MKKTVKALFIATVFTASAFAQTADTARVLFRINPAEGLSAVTVTVAPGGPGGGACVGMQRAVTPRESGRDTVLLVYAPGATSVLHGARRQSAPAAVASNNRGTVSLRLDARQYENAGISLYSANGKQVLRGKASASDGTFAVSRQNIASGVYFLSVKGVDGNIFTARIAHGGGRLNINAAFGGANPSLAKQAAVSDCGPWTLTLSAEGFDNVTRQIDLNVLNIGAITMTRTVVPCTPGVDCPEGGPHTPCQPNEDCEIFSPPSAKANFTETVGSQSIEMLYIEGGTFDIGCSGSNCGYGTTVVKDVTVSPYFISKTTVSSQLWTAVMGSSKPLSDMDWYDAFAFACKLSQMTGKNYRMTTEAEWEFAAVKRGENGMTIPAASMNTEEWAYNSWKDRHAGGTDPVGEWSGWCTQKTRRNASDGRDQYTSRLIRSIEGIGPQLRLAISATAAFPPDYVPSCNLKHPVSQSATTPNTYRDPRWVTGGDMRWEHGSIAMGQFTLHAWEDGTARLTSSYGGGAVNGQWFSSNNMSLVFVPSSGSGRRVYKYIFQDPRQCAIISDERWMNGGFVGRIVKMPVASPVSKPSVSGLMSGEELAKSQPDYNDYFVRYDFANLPESAKKKDGRLLDGPNYGWFQDNSTAGGVHHYRKDIDSDNFRFVVYQGNATNLAYGDWFTVNNTFLRITDPRNNYTSDYLYAITPGDTLYHNSYMGYEPGDFRMFGKKANNTTFPCGTGAGCNSEISTSIGTSMYATGQWTTRGKSTFVPPPCPAGGCQ